MTVLMRLDDVAVRFPLGRRRSVSAVDGVSLDIVQGQTLGLIGESGSGKSTLARAMLGLVPTSAGSVSWLGEDVARMPRQRRHDFTGEVQMVFQDPHSALDPRRRVHQSVREPLDVLRRGERRDRDELTRRALADVGLPAHLHDRYPHQLSGGQKQRVNIARALVTRPRLIVCDESVAALDVALQAEILNLLGDLKDEHDLTVVFISHDLGVVGHIADRVAVMYLGKLVETAAADDLLEAPRHPYTEALLSARPDVHQPGGGDRIVLRGDVPSPLAPPSGCRFHPRCLHASAACARDLPVLVPVESGGASACLRVADLYGPVPADPRAMRGAR
ncbi:oligopeptide/dipeptide ABC transporter ATP-binding protein [Nocardioides humi]|uniref:Dipeptide ABC transporter ATP-binding protein n=1 Tax=Nocardioides humi TaxID=449461 RepID=A0ABN2AYU6_9ACTN|nr:ABC transporter ATP-binding protein [Nocardioides humi]